MRRCASSPDVLCVLSTTSRASSSHLMRFWTRLGVTQHMQPQHDKINKVKMHETHTISHIFSQTRNTIQFLLRRCLQSHQRVPSHSEQRQIFREKIRPL